MMSNVYNARQRIACNSFCSLDVCDKTNGETKRGPPHIHWLYRRKQAERCRTARWIRHGRISPEDLRGGVESGHAKKVVRGQPPCAPSCHVHLHNGR